MVLDTRLSLCCPDILNMQLLSYSSRGVVSRKERGGTESKLLPSQGMIWKFYSYSIWLNVS